VRVLSINCGSSSLKYAFFEVDEAEEKTVFRSVVDRVGTEVADHGQAVEAAFRELAARGLGSPDVVGHRVVNGGAEHLTPALVDDALLASLAELAWLAPLHLPAEILAIRAARGRWSGRPQVACFDTAFHRTLSDVAKRYALPESMHESGVRRYGFHGLSYEFVVESVGARELGRAVLAHLGSGASMAAVVDGRAVDTTMGFTPTSGLVMGTRPGDIDPGLVVYLVSQGYDAARLDDVFNRRSGLLALSGTTQDVRDLLQRSNRDPRAAFALDVFAWSARKWVGAMAAAIGGLDSLVFTGGVGEHAAPVRAAIARGLEHLGVHLDDERNQRGDPIVSRDGATCRVRVVHTDEERMVARHARRLTAG
jgi:acetate kinase